MNFVHKEKVISQKKAHSLSTDKLAKTTTQSDFKRRAEREEKSKMNRRSISLA